VPRQSDTILAAIKRAVDIVALVGDYLPLHRHGSKVKALCPFHDDHKPSLELNPDRQSYKCWSCGAGGDVFDFVQEYERVDFPEAVRMLAERAGITLEKTATEGSASAGASKAELLDTLAWAERAYAEALAERPEAAEARDYLSKRNINGESVARFKLGYAPDSRGWLIDRAKRKGRSTILLERAGLLLPSDRPDAPPRERFHGRLIFPIHDPRGRVLGFGGRVLPSVEERLAATGAGIAKYVNSPETPLFQKRRLLYGADLAREGARREGFVAVVEGYTDVIMAHQLGATNVVGTMGTALGDDHVIALRRLADRVVLVFDGDAAGQAAADRSLEIFLGHEVDVRVLTLPAGFDPCDFLVEAGVEAFQDMARNAADPLTFVVDRVSYRYDLSSIEQSRVAAETVLATLAKLPRTSRAGLDIKLAKALDSLAFRLRVPVESLHRRLAELRREAARVAASRARGDAARRGALAPSTAVEGSQSVPNANGAAQAIGSSVGDGSGVVSEAAAARPKIRPAQLDPIDREIVQMALDYPESVAGLISRVTVESLRDPATRAILQACYDLYAEGVEPAFEAVIVRLEQPEVRSLAADLVSPIDPVPMPDRVRPAAPEDRLAGVLARYSERLRQERIHEVLAARAEIDKEAEPELYRALTEEYLGLLHHKLDLR
jgi:DNA primase